MARKDDALRYPRKNGKQWLSLLDWFEVEFGAPKDELEAIAKKYRPTLEAIGLLDDLQEYQQIVLWFFLWKHDKEIEGAAKGIIPDLHVEWDDE